MNQKSLSLLTTREIALIGIFAALISVTAPISIPLTGSVPISLATLSVMLTGVLLGKRNGVLAVIIYLILGSIGMPVFAGYSSGFAKILGVTGGYMIGYIPYAWLSGLFAEKSVGMTGSKKIGMLAAGMLLGTAACYILGTVWFCVSTGSGLGYALSVCVVPFLFGDALKIVAVCLLSSRLQPLADKALRG